MTGLELYTALMEFSPWLRSREPNDWRDLIHDAWLKLHERYEGITVESPRKLAMTILRFVLSDRRRYHQRWQLEELNASWPSSTPTSEMAAILNQRIQQQNEILALMRADYYWDKCQGRGKAAAQARWRLRNRWRDRLAA